MLGFLVLMMNLILKPICKYILSLIIPVLSIYIKTRKDSMLTKINFPLKSRKINALLT